MPAIKKYTTADRLALAFAAVQQASTHVLAIKKDDNSIHCEEGDMVHSALNSLVALFNARYVVEKNPVQELPTIENIAKWHEENNGVTPATETVITENDTPRSNTSHSEKVKK